MMFEGRSETEVLEHPLLLQNESSPTRCEGFVGPRYPIYGLSVVPGLEGPPDEATDSGAASDETRLERMTARGKPFNITVVAIARELAAFIWDIRRLAMSLAIPRSKPPAACV